MPRSITDSDAPTSLQTIHRPMRVAINGVFEPRLRVTQLKLGCDGDISEATLQAYLGAIQPSAYHPGEGAMSVTQFISGNPYWGGVSPDQVITIYRDGLDDAQQVLLRGFSEVQTYIERGSVGGSDSGGTLVVSSVLKRVNKLESSQVFGRYVRQAASIDAWRELEAEAKLSPLGDDDDLQWLHRPTTFNARGEANRQAAPITVTINGRSEQLYVFTDDEDPEAEPWTWAQALRYLVYFHLGGDLVGRTNLYDQTRAYLGDTIDQRPLSPVSETSGYDGDPSTLSRLFQYAMLGMPSDAVFEGTSIVEAMTIVAKATDTHFKVQTWFEGGQIGDDLIWWARGGGPRREVCKAPQGDEVPEILESLNLEQMTLSVDYGDVVTTPIGLGDVRRYEITTELIPGWKPDANVDRPANIDAAIAASTDHGENLNADDTWCQKYHPGGASFNAYANVGRRWVLNETGRYPAVDYARTSGHFGTSKYDPWEPADCSIVDRTFVNGAWSEEAVNWTRHPRPFQPCFSADAAGRSIGVVVEASFDGGTNWEPLGCKVLATEAGIYIETDDLSRLMSQYDGGPSWWAAMCNDNARVRVTAVIEGDRALLIIGSAARAAVSHEASRLYDWRSRFKSNYRTTANSIYKPGGERATTYQTFECRDDSPTMDQWIASLCDLNAGRQIPGTFTIPWLECTRYQVGDCVPFVRGAVELQGEVSGGVRRPPDIVAIVYGETSTQLVLEDARMAEMKG
jgi:hypothetical protein